MNRPIVVGVDGSADSLAAAHYAAATAKQINTSLRMIHVFDTVFHGYGPLLVAGTYAVADAQLRQAAQTSLSENLREIKAAYPDVEIESKLIDGMPTPVLIAESQDAYATVVGSRGMGGFAELLLGSVSSQLAAHGHGPIVVVRPAADPDGPILVGFDGSDESYAALDFGVREALARNVRLVVTNVYWEQPWGFGHKPEPDPAITAEKHAVQMLTDAIELSLEQYPQLQGEIRAIHGINTEHEMVQASAEASLTVVGSRGRGGFAGLLLGSVSQALVHHAAGPVAVVHPAGSEEDR